MTASDTKKTYVFTDSQDWFSFNVETWRLLFPRIRSASPRVLEIGSWEGRSAVFLLDELCGESGSLTCIDHFDLKQTPAGCQRYVRVTHNLSATGKAFRIMDQFSVPALMTLLEEEMSSSEPGFDFIYVDGSHEADDTFLDGELAWRLARKGAIVIFDDYHWPAEPQDSRHHPKRGIDAFMSLHAEEYEKLSSPTQYQMVLQKTSDMRIGFLVKARTSENTQSFGYGINIAYTIDKAYAMPLAVSLRSLLSYTPGRVSAYILTQNMSNDLQEKIRQSLPLRDDFTLQFLELGDREEMLAFKFGMTWAKIDLIDVIPTERVLYLDADTLIRQDIRAMWETDLCGKPLAAIQDIGYPLGREESSRVPYFNAGVLLLDLAQIRQSKVQLLSQAFTQRNSHFRDQDALNAHFAGNWHALPLAWNAQGLGTYAKLSSTERDALDLSAMFPPRIVHFTGPVHPSMNAILNDWGQPYTAKPWGYAGAPGHPFAREWWEVLEETAWKGYRSDTEFAKICEDEAKKAEETGVACFRERVAASSRSI